MMSGGIVILLVIPAKAGIQLFGSHELDSGFRRNDG